MLKTFARQKKSLAAEGAKAAKENNSLTAKGAEGAKEEKSFTAEDAKDAKEEQSLTAKVAENAKGILIRIQPQGRKDNAKGGIQETPLVILPPSPLCPAGHWSRLFKAREDNAKGGIQGKPLGILHPSSALPFLAADARCKKSIRKLTGLRNLCTRKRAEIL
jgi:hypothetical protein